MVSIEGWLENWLKNCWADFASRQSGLFCKHHVGLVGYARCRKNGPLTCHPNWLWIMNYRYESCFGKKPSPRNTVIALGYIRQYLFAGDTGRAGSSSRSHVLELELSRLLKGFQGFLCPLFGTTLICTSTARRGWLIHKSTSPQGTSRLTLLVSHAKGYVLSVEGLKRCFEGYVSQRNCPLILNLKILTFC